MTTHGLKRRGTSYYVASSTYPASDAFGGVKRDRNLSIDLKFVLMLYTLSLCTYGTFVGKRTYMYRSQVAISVRSCAITPFSGCPWL